MSRWTISLFLLIITSPVLATSTPQEATPSDPRQLNERVAAVGTWLTAGVDVVNQTKDPEAGAILRYLIRTSILGIAQPEGYDLARDGSVDRLVVIAPILPGDETLDDHWQYFADQAVGGAFCLLEKRLLVLQHHQEISPAWRGVMLLQAGHIFFMNDLRPDEGREYLSRARDAHAFGQRLLTELGGERYSQLIEDAAQGIKATGGDVGLMKALAPTLVYPGQLDQIFGESASPLEHELRRTTFWIGTSFRFIDMTVPQADQNEQKSLFLKRLYARPGLFH